MKTLFDVLIYPISVTDHILINFLITAIYGVVAYKSAYFLVGETDFRGLLGSLLHWSIRIFVYLALCYFTKLIIITYLFLIGIPYYVYIALFLIIFLLFLYIYSIKNKKSILNYEINIKFKKSL